MQIIALTIKASIQVGRDMDAHLAALTAIKEAHESGDYTKVLAMATIDAVKSEQKTRRIDVGSPAPAVGQRAGTYSNDADFAEVDAGPTGSGGNNAGK
ncbi:MAG: hypothetical protein HC900_00215 [Methylacidiphilales bacterium]|nr:hypothetical protein [Candidatus Methylacidiphilales bacterium]